MTRLPRSLRRPSPSSGASSSSRAGGRSSASGIDAPRPDPSGRPLDSQDARGSAGGVGHGSRTARRRQLAASLSLTALVAAILAVVGAPGSAARTVADPVPTPTPLGSPSPEPSPPPGLSMAVRPLLGGHARAGGWLAVAVDLANEGPPISGELRVAGGPGGRVVFNRPVELPTNSQKREVLYVQAPTLGQRLAIGLVAGGHTLARAPIEVSLHDAPQLLVGIVAERPQPLIAAVRGLPTGPTGGPAVVPLAPGDLPERVEAWSALDRLLWQDVDTSALSADQLAALRAWLAGGGRLVFLGGTGGLGVLARVPDDLLPFRPTATIDLPTEALRGLVGQLPEEPREVPALAGPLLRGRALVSLGEAAVVAEAAYGAGTVTLLGIDPTVDPIASNPGTSGLWSRLLPPRSAGGLTFVDDGPLVSALTNLPALALPPIGGLLALLVGYIVLIGPLNYLVLRRLDRREWAWITMPLLIVGFAAAAYGYGSFLRGSDVIVNEISIVGGAAGAAEGRGQVYVGVFSPSRGTYDLTLAGGPLVAAPLSDIFGGLDVGGTALDVVQGDPARIRGLSIGFGALRAFKAELPATVPLVATDLRLVDGVLTGRIENRSQRRLLAPAVVFGASSATLPDLAPGAATTIRLPLTRTAFGTSLADRIVGAFPAVDTNPVDDAARERMIRYQIVNQLTYDPFGSLSGLWLPADGPVLIAWDREPLAQVAVAGTTPRRLGTTLYYLTLPVRIEGAVVFGADLIRSTVLANESAFFSKDPWTYSLGQGSLTVAYRTIGLSSPLTPTRLLVGFTGPELGPAAAGAVEIEPVGPAAPIELCPEAPCPNAAPDGLPELEVFDVVRGEWMALPHLDGSRVFAIREPARYVDPASATVLFRFQNPRLDGIGFGFAVQIEGRVG